MARNSSVDSKPLWRPEWDAVLRREWGKISTRAIAQRFGVSIKTVNNHAEALGLPHKRPGQKHVE